jgi:hypothetical protein
MLQDFSTKRNDWYIRIGKTAVFKFGQSGAEPASGGKDDAPWLEPDLSNHLITPVGSREIQFSSGFLN